LLEVREGGGEVGWGRHVGRGYCCLL
jgi:hypothetical protein